MLVVRRCGITGKSIMMFMLLLSRAVTTMQTNIDADDHDDVHASVIRIIIVAANAVALTFEPWHWHFNI